MMPYTIAKQGDQWCVYKKGDDGKAEGDSLGCHDSQAEAQAQIGAIESNENGRSKMVGIPRRRMIEQRVLPLEVALRAGEDADAPKLVGHAAVFNEWTRIGEAPFGELFEEQVAPGAFRKTIREGDIRALWNHDPNIVLGRVKAGTLELREDEKGLSATIMPPDNEWGRPVLDAVKRGDVNGMSIAFQVVKDSWVMPDKQAEPGTLRKRTIREAKLFEVSPVTFPAYPQTDIGARAENGEDESRLLRAFRAARLAELGLALEADERAEVRKIAEFMVSVSGEPGPIAGNHSPEAQSDEPAPDGQPSIRSDHSESARARRLQMMQLQMEA